MWVACYDPKPVSTLFYVLFQAAYQPVTNFEPYDYSYLRDQLDKAGIPLSPAEVHGVACGLAASGMEDMEGLWHQVVFEEVDQNDILVQEARRSLDGMLDRTLAELDDESFGLVLCMPEDDATVRQQAEALRDWCQGFLFGFGLAGEDLHARLSADAGEALQDMTEITRLDAESVEDDEEGERGVAELEEYLRVSALTIRQDVLSAQRGHGS